MKIKRIIAKEGLILLGIAALGVAVYFAGRHLNSEYLIHHTAAKFKVINNMQYSLVGYNPYVKVMSFGLGIVVFGYPVIAVIRFIFWAAKMLKKR